jgi:hypothetical protein
MSLPLDLIFSFSQLSIGSVVSSSGSQLIVVGFLTLFSLQLIKRTTGAHYPNSLENDVLHALEMTNYT